MNSGKRAIGFDLDYTLWDQDVFAHSFFDAIAEDVGFRLGLTSSAVATAFKSALNRLTLYHPRLYDEALKDLGSSDQNLVAELVERYHNHRPAIRLYPSAEETLAYLKASGYRLFLVTDGYSETQKYKVDALGIGPYFEIVIFTGDYPRELRKPNPFLFSLVAERMGLEPEECIYIGDNPQCDFEGPKRIGMQTIGVSTGPFVGFQVHSHQAPDLRIGQLAELRHIL
jgi:putative hydrolase of the HAD superfamily